MHDERDAGPPARAPGEDPGGRGRETGELRNRIEAPLGTLARQPRFGAILAHVHGRVHDFHRRVVLERHLVGRLDALQVAATSAADAEAALDGGAYLSADAVPIGATGYRLLRDERSTPAVLSTYD